MSTELLGSSLPEVFVTEGVPESHAIEIKRLVRQIYVLDDKRNAFLASGSLELFVKGKLANISIEEGSSLKIDPREAGNNVQMFLRRNDNVYLAITGIDTRKKLALHYRIASLDENGPELQLGVNQWLLLLREIAKQTEDKRPNYKVV